MHHSPSTSVASDNSNDRDHDSSAVNDGQEFDVEFLARMASTSNRQRTSQACDKCRDRKTKCTGDRPVCKRCASRGLICQYTRRDFRSARIKPHPVVSVGDLRYGGLDGEHNPSDSVPGHHHPSHPSHPSDVDQQSLHRSPEYNSRHHEPRSYDHTQSHNQWASPSPPAQTSQRRPLAAASSLRISAPTLPQSHMHGPGYHSQPPSIASSPTYTIASPIPLLGNSRQPEQPQHVDHNSHHNHQSHPANVELAWQQQYLQYQLAFHADAQQNVGPAHGHPAPINNGPEEFHRRPLPPQWTVNHPSNHPYAMSEANSVSSDASVPYGSAPSFSSLHVAGYSHLEYPAVQNVADRDEDPVFAYNAFTPPFAGNDEQNYHQLGLAPGSRRRSEPSALDGKPSSYPAVSHSEGEPYRNIRHNNYMTPSHSTPVLNGTYYDNTRTFAGQVEENLQGIQSQSQRS